MTKQETPDKVVVEKHVCLNCGKTNNLIILERSESLNKEIKKALKKEGVIIIKKGKIFSCPHCSHKVEAK
jgi:DNA-directed RNA polymerase subunit RPC12/RpoP